MIKDFMTFARALDAFCGRLNAGLAAIAIVLAFIVTGLAVVRAQQYVPTAMAGVATSYQPVLEQ